MVPCVGSPLNFPKLQEVSPGQILTFFEMRLSEQTTPHYLSRLSKCVAPIEYDDLLRTIMFTLYGNHYQSREEHLLLALIGDALNQEVYANH